METRQLPSPERQEHAQQHPYVVLTWIFIGIIWVLVLVVGIGILHGPWASWWAFIGLGGLAALVSGTLTFFEKHKEHQRHHQAIENEKHHRKMTELAILHDHSAEHITETSSFRAVSKYMGPAASTIIRDNQFGGPQLGAAALPGPMRLLDIMQRRAFAGIYLASGRGQREIECTLGGLLHAAHDAPTGQGKTNQWKSEIVQLRKHKVFVILCNPHFLPVSKGGEDWRPIGKSIEEQGTIEIMPGVHLPGLVRKYEQIVQFLRWLSLHEIDSRFTRATQGDFTYPVLYLFIDEWPAIVRRFPEAADHLVDVLQRGRAVDICCSVNAQGFLQGDVDLKGSARENFNTAIHMGGNVVSGSKLLDMPQKVYNDLLKNEQITLGKGVALLRNNEVCPQAELVRLPLVDNDSVYYLLGRADDWTLPEFRNVSGNLSGNFRNGPVTGNLSSGFRNGMKSDEEPFQDDIPEISRTVPPEREIVVSPEIRNEIIRLHEQGFNRTQIRDSMRFNGEQFKIIKAVLDDYEES